MKNSIIIILVVISFNSISNGQTVFVQGEDEICPNSRETYHIWAENIFGNKIEGTIRWEAYKNGVKIEGVGNAEVPVPCPPSSSTKNHYIYIERDLDSIIANGFYTGGDIDLRVYFYKNNSCNSKNGYKTIRSKGIPYGKPVSSSNGELVICSPGTTKTVYLDPGYGQSSPTNNCSYHNIFEWEVSANWIVKSASGAGANSDFYVGGQIVQITAPSNVSSGQGYPLTVSPTDEVGKPWISENWLDPTSREIWIGAPKSMTASVNGPSTPAVGSQVTYFINTDLPGGAADFEWILPYGGSFPSQGSGWAILNQVGNQVQVRVGTAAGYVQVRGVNSCGNGGAKIKWVTPQSSGGGPDPIQQMTVYPNPSESGVFMIFTQRILQESNFKAKQNMESWDTNSLTYRIISENGELITQGKVENESFEINLSNENEGIYYLKVYKNKEDVYETRLIR